ncbi:hypothetical protein [Clostridium sp.]
MDDKIEYLRAKLYESLDNGNESEILEASIALDIEIVKDMLRSYRPNEIMSKGIKEENINGKRRIKMKMIGVMRGEH